MAQVTQRGWDAPSLETFKTRVGWGSEQPDPVEAIPVHGRGEELDNF